MGGHDSPCTETTRTPATKLQVGSCHGKLNYSPFETVFDGSKVRRDAKLAALEVKKSLDRRILVDPRSRKHRVPWTVSTELTHSRESRSIFSPMKKGEDIFLKNRPKRAANKLGSFGTTDSRNFSSENRTFLESRGALWNGSTELQPGKAACSEQDLPGAKAHPVPKNYRSPVELEYLFAANLRQAREVDRQQRADGAAIRSVTLADLKDPEQEKELASEYSSERLAQYLKDQEASSASRTESSKVNKQKRSFTPAINHNIPLPSYTLTHSEHNGTWALNAAEGAMLWSCCLSGDSRRVPGCSKKKTVFRRVS